MAARFTVLASGSSGNCALLEAGGHGVLIDLGLGPRLIASRLAAAGANWNAVRAALLTHTHGDHWNDRSLARLRQRNVPLWHHAGHREVLGRYGEGFASLVRAGLVREFEPGQPFDPAPGVRATAFAVCHDSGSCFAFRLEGGHGLFGPGWSVGYLSDLGCWAEDLAAFLDGVDVLAVEYNHDVAMERRSGRSAELVRRVLGDEGHLSNIQAAGLTRAVLDGPGGAALKHVVQLHLSRDCNRPELAVAAARAALAGGGEAVQVHTAAQDRVGPVLALEANGRAARWSGPRAMGGRRGIEPRPALPGLDG
jgi:phosphoribosyl 1,2-cyclic phosphodiesterase